MSWKIINKRKIKNLLRFKYQFVKLKLILIKCLSLNSVNGCLHNVYEKFSIIEYKMKMLCFFTVFLFVWLLEILLNLKKLRGTSTILNKVRIGKK